MKEMPCLIYSRVCGYYQPTVAWHKGKQEEFEQRVEYKISKMGLGSDSKTK